MYEYMYNQFSSKDKYVCLYEKTFYLIHDMISSDLMMEYLLSCNKNPLKTKNEVET